MWTQNMKKSPLEVNVIQGQKGKKWSRCGWKIPTQASWHGLWKKEMEKAIGDQRLLNIIEQDTIFDDELFQD
jgi:hypothetical protein